MTSLQDMWNKVQELFEGLEASQEKRVWKVANRINPKFILDDLLNPQDHPELAQHPDFNYEDGQLSGMRATRIAINALLKELMIKEASPESRARHRTYQSEPWGWDISDETASTIFTKIMERRQSREPRDAVVFDLDGTLFDVGYRTIGILKEWLTGPEVQKFPAALIKKVSSIDYAHVGYSLAHCFENVGFDLREEEVIDIFESAERHWKRYFFDGKSLARFDKPVAGASTFVNECVRAGLKIVYLSGRHDASMREGTREQLLLYGFPLENTEIVLKGQSSIEDLTFKEEAFAELCTRYNVCGNFENEYINLAAMTLNKPETVHVILDTHHSGRPVPPLRHRVHRIKSFE